MKPLTREEIAEIRKLDEGGEATALEWRAAVLAAHPFLLDEVERSRALLKRIEWVPLGIEEPWYDGCPSCKAPQQVGQTHKPDCELAALIGG